MHPMNRWPALAEFRSLGVLAVPLIITQLAQMGMGVADAIMAGRVSATDLAGIALGGNLYWPLMLSRPTRACGGASSTVQARS